MWIARCDGIEAAGRDRHEREQRKQPHEAGDAANEEGGEELGNVQVVRCNRPAADHSHLSHYCVHKEVVTPLFVERLHNWDGFPKKGGSSIFHGDERSAEFW